MKFKDHSRKIAVLIAIGHPIPAMILAALQTDKYSEEIAMEMIRWFAFLVLIICVFAALGLLR